MSKFYDDIGLDGSDLLNKGFPNGSSVKVTAETKTDNGVSLVATGRRFVKDKNVGVELALEPKFDWAAKNVELSATANTNNEYSGTFVLKDFGAKGTKFTSVSTFSDKGASIKETAQYKNENVATKASYIQPIDNDKPMTIDGSLAGAFEKKYFGGATASFTPSKGDKPSAVLWGTKLGFDHADFQAHLFANSTAKSLFVGAGWFQKATADLKVAATASADVNKVAGPSATLGSEYKFDALTAIKTKLNVQTSVDNKPLEARLGLGLKQSLSPNITATIGADVNVRQLFGVNAGGDHTFGLEVKLI